MRVIGPGRYPATDDGAVRGFLGRDEERPAPVARSRPIRANRAAPRSRIPCQHPTPARAAFEFCHAEVGGATLVGAVLQLRHAQPSAPPPGHFASKRRGAAAWPTRS
jgi:hypothetical protein